MKRKWLIVRITLLLLVVITATLVFTFRPNTSQDPAELSAKIHPADLLPIVNAPADGKKSEIVGTSSDDRFVLCHWRKAGAHWTIQRWSEPPPIDHEHNLTGFEVWDRLKGTRKRWSSFEKAYCHPSGTVVIQQTLSNGSRVFTFAPNTEQLATILDTRSPEYHDSLSGSETGLHLNQNGTSAFVVIEKNRDSNEILQWDLDAHVIARRVPVEIGGAILAVSPDGSRLAMKYKAGNKVKIWDVRQASTLSVTTIPEDFFSIYGSYRAEFLPDNRTLNLKVLRFGAQEQIINTDNGQKYRAGADSYQDYDASTGYWLRLRGGIWNPVGWEVVNQIDEAAQPLCRLELEKNLKINRARFVPKKGLVAASCEDNRSANAKKHVILIFDAKSGKVRWTIERDSDPYIDYHQAPTPTHDGSGLFFLTQHENQMILDCWKIPGE